MGTLIPMNDFARVRPLPLPGIGAIASGPPDARECLLFLPGWGASKELWHNTLRLLGGEFRCVAVDLPGTHATPSNPALVTMRDMARWTALVCEHLGAEHLTLVGHSLGGNLAAQTALDFPKLVSRLVLVDAALNTANLPRRALWVLSPRFGLHALRLTRWASGPLAWAGRRVPHAHTGGHWGPMVRRTHLFLAHTKDVSLRAHLAALHGNPLNAAALAPLSLPILLLHGARDTIVPPADAREVADALPQALLHIFPHAHHAPMDSEPQAFADTLAAWLRRTQGNTRGE